MPSARKMPLGKMQFGIIIPTRLHDRAKQLTGIIGGRISDVYARGVEELWAKVHGEEVAKTKREQDLEDISRGLPEEHMPYLTAMANFLKSNPEESDLQMQSLMLRKFLPADFTMNSTIKSEKHG